MAACCVAAGGPALQHHQQALSSEVLWASAQEPDSLTVGRMARLVPHQSPWSRKRH